MCFNPFHRSDGYPLFYHQDGPACIAPVRECGRWGGQPFWGGGKLPGSLKGGGDLADDRRDYVRMEADIL